MQLKRLHHSYDSHSFYATHALNRRHKLGHTYNIKYQIIIL